MGVLTALQYGVVGLCGVMLLLAWKVLADEQRRVGAPRAALLKHLRLYMGFCLAVGVLASGLQVLDRGAGRSKDQQMTEIRGRLHSLQQLLDQKMNIEVQRLTDDTAKHQLRYIVGLIQNDVRDALKFSEDRR